MELTELSLDDWYSIYEHLDGDGHLSIDGRANLQQLKERLGKG